MPRHFDDSREQSNKDFNEQFEKDSIAQLILTTKELVQIGFKKVRYTGSQLNNPKKVYEIPCMNGCFYFNPNQEEYVWYHKLIIGEMTHYTNLNINSVPNLYAVLSSFNVKHNFVVF